MRILWVSDAPWSTSGYGVQTALAVPRLIGLGHEVAALCTWGLGGATIEWQGIKTYPGGADPFANDVINASAHDWKADIVITLKDSFVFRPDAFRGLRWCPMVPVDHEPLTPQISEILRHAFAPIAYARHGEQSLFAAGFDPLYAPHAYDPAVYYPGDKREAREKLGIPMDRFLVGTVAVNRGGIPSRKAWPQNIEAFARFAASNPDAVYLTHTYVGTDGAEGSVNLPFYASRYGVPDRVLFPDQQQFKAGFATDYLRTYYQAIDVLLATSIGEGFGVPTLEAQACGTPVVVSGWCASEELCFAGEIVTRDEAIRMPDSQMTDVYIPQPAAIADKLQRVADRLRDPAQADAMRTQALARAEAYQIDAVAQTYWRPLLEEIEQRMALEHVYPRYLRVVSPEEILL